MNKSILIIILSIYMAMQNIHAAPNGADLLKACKSALEHGFSDVDGMLCSWYVTPCDCDYGNNSHLPRVCLPQPADIDALASKVVSGLMAQPELQEIYADMAAATILFRHYPCDE